MNNNSSWEVTDKEMRPGGTTKIALAQQLKRALQDEQHIVATDLDGISRLECLEIFLRMYCIEHAHDPAFFQMDGLRVRTTPRATREILALSRGFERDEVNSIIEKSSKASYGYRKWVEYGRPIYEVSEMLSWVFLNTELADLTLSEISIPYDACIIRLNNLAPIEYNNKYTGTPEIYKPACVLLEPNLNEENPYIQLVIECFHTTDDDAPMVVNQSLGYLSRTSSDKMLKDCVESDGEPWVRTAFYYAVNVLLYASSTASDDVLRATSLPYLQLERRVRKAKGPAKKRFQEQLKKIPPKMVHFLGHNTIIDRKKTDVDLAEGKAENSTSLIQRKGSFVCGHWHHYWIGKGRTEKIRKLIMPFWRGAPPTEEQLAETHKYLLK